MDLYEYEKRCTIQRDCLSVGILPSIFAVLLFAASYMF